MHVQAGRAGTDEGVGRVASVVDPPLAVVVDERLVLLERARDVGREQRVAPLRGQVGRRGARGAAVPDADRVLQRARPRRERVERRPVRAGPRDVLLAEQAAQQLVVLGVAVPLVVVGVAEDPGLLLGVALADDDLDAPAGDDVERGVVLGDADRVEQRQHGHAGEQADALRRSRRGSRG